MNKVKRPVFRLCNDSVFKEIFSKVPNALAMLISDVLGVNYEYLKDNIIVERSELNKDNNDNKSTTCDYIVKITDNFKIDIELNTSKYSGLNERNLLYATRLYSNMVPKGLSYSDFPDYKVAQININSFGNVTGDILSMGMFTYLGTNMPLTSSVTLYFLDIVKGYKMYYNIEKGDIVKNDKLVRWGALLYTEDISDIANIIGDDLMPKEDKKRFVEVANSLNEKYNNFTQEQLEQLMEFKLEGERLAGYEEGCAFGVAEGHAAGIAEGHASGLTETAINMLKKDLNIELISEITGLTKEEIMKLKETL